MATYYAIAAGGNWSAGGTWSTTSTKSVARTGGATQPTNADDCILDDWSGSVTVDTTTCVAKTANCTTNGNYAGTLTFTSGQILAISGSVTFASTMTLSGTGTLRIAATSTLTTAGKTIPGALSLNAAVTYTLADALAVTGTTTFSGAGSTVATGGNNLTLSAVTASGNTTFTGAGTVAGTTFSIANIILTLAANWTFTGGITQSGSSGTSTINGAFSLSAVGLSQSTNVLAGTATVVLTGGTWQDGSTTANVSCNLTISTGTVTISGTVTFASATHVFTFASGTLTGGTLEFGASAGAVIDAATGGAIASNLSFLSRTYTLNSDLTTSGTISILDVSPTFAGAHNIQCATLNFGKLQASNRTLTLVATQTLTVTTAISLEASNVAGITMSVVSDTPSTATKLAYTGTNANQKISGVIFTDVDASVSSNPIFNYAGGTLTRTTNIYNIDPSSFPAVGDVRNGTSYAGGALTGTYSAGGGGTGGSYTFVK